ncbi:DUF2304 domain-containing protein [Nocardioides coralli]|uniref:DUF2304 domain-containing protein n=1 Tax=Nocardioides coralli TaxID=2872154 RepID=UPI001CA45721|nr:DUF2304 domain-containing protein [Nocardioides coralli]QZY28028.1 DUF2304 domain-containing protein [Nocardioides coralli]
MIVKVLLIASILAALAWMLRARPTGRRLAVTRLAGLAAAVCWIVAVLDPGLVSWVANLVGVGRGTDLVLYALVVVFLFTTVGLYQRLKHLEAEIAELARDGALLRYEVEHRPSGNERR